MYYSDTFNSILGEAGTLIKRRVEEFTSYYNSVSGSMLGAVHFEGDENGGFHPDEMIYSEYIAKDGCTVCSSPLEQLGGAGEAPVPVAAGEKLAVRGAYVDGYNNRWLRIEGGNWVKESETVKSGNYSTIVCENMTIPVTWLYRHAFTMGGTVTSHGGAFTYFSVTISDMEGNVVIGGVQENVGSAFSLSAIDEETYFEHLAPGKYRYKIEATNAFEHAVVFNAEFEILAYGRSKDEKFYEYTETHKLYSACDTDFSGSVDEMDISRLKEGATWGNGGYLCDVNGDGSVNLTDMYLINQEITKASE